MNIIKAIIAINPNANVSIEDNDINQITWLNETAVISKSDIETKLVELQTALDAKEYQRKRAEEYPSMADQLDHIYHNGVEKWKKTIKAVKDKYPKE